MINSNAIIILNQQFMHMRTAFVRRVVIYFINNPNKATTKNSSIKKKLFCKFLLLKIQCG